jgi:mono/diheme cytochrome c family protein
MVRTWIWLPLAALLIGAAGAAAYSWEPELEAVEPTAEFPPQDVARGAQLASIGNCVTCHTEAGGASFAGGLAIETPFGTIHSTNITPDPDTGIGRWSEEAFARSMREGVDREGNHLYPAFPYDHFTLTNDADLRSLYAFLMTRKPVAAQAEANSLTFPLNVRPLLAGWKLLFHRSGTYRDDPAQSAEWNRGAYLAEGLAHCGACHTPRNALGAVDRDRHFAGGEAEGWHAYAINEASPAPVPWTVDSLAFYLRNGWHEHHGISRGSMAPVTTNLAAVPEDDIRAMATYVVSRMGELGPERQARGEAALKAAEASNQPAPETSADSQISPDLSDKTGDGARIYEAACANCHESGRPQPYGGLNLHLSTAVNAANPSNIINVVMFGLPQAAGEASPVMPGFHNTLTDEQMAALLAYMRETFSDKPAWDDPLPRIRAVRSGEIHVQNQPTDGASRAPHDPQALEPTW